MRRSPLAVGTSTASRIGSGAGTVSLFTVPSRATSARRPPTKTSTPSLSAGPIAVAPPPLTQRAAASEGAAVGCGATVVGSAFGVGATGPEQAARPSPRTAAALPERLPCEGQREHTRPRGAIGRGAYHQHPLGCAVVPADDAASAPGDHGMRKTSFFAALLATLASVSVADAFCGFYVGGADASLFNNATQVVLMREGTRTVLSMQNN